MIDIVLYNLHGLATFQLLAPRWRGAVGDRAFRSDSIGSTAVPGLTARTAILLFRGVSWFFEGKRKREE